MNSQFKLSQYIKNFCCTVYTVTRNDTKVGFVGDSRDSGTCAVLSLWSRKKFLENYLLKRMAENQTQIDVQHNSLYVYDKMKIQRTTLERYFDNQRVYVFMCSYIPLVFLFFLNQSQLGKSMSVQQGDNHTKDILNWLRDITRLKNNSIVTSSVCI